jgi:hypothetical protein
VRCKKIFGKTLCLLAEEQVALVFELGLGVAPGSFGGKAPQLMHIVFGEEILQIVIDPYIYQMPVVQSRTLDGFV